MKSYLTKTSLNTLTLPALLICSVVLGGFFGLHNPSLAISLKPAGDVLLNLIFVTIVPLVFFSISSAVANVSNPKTIGRLLSIMIFVFLSTGIIAALWMLLIIKIFPDTSLTTLHSIPVSHTALLNPFSNLVTVFTVPDITKLLMPDHMLALIVFSLLTGFATGSLKEEALLFSKFLSAGSAICMKIMSFIMWYAPIGFFAYFSALIASLGNSLLTEYIDITKLYYLTGIFYFIFIFSLYAYLSAGKSGWLQFWKQVWLPAITALGTCSSAASIPANLKATQEIGVNPLITETVIPIGHILNKTGTVLGAIVKIAFLFAFFHLSLSGGWVLCTAIIVAILTGSVMGAIPSGGMLGEMLILSLYGFPAEALMMIAAISILIDPLATLLNVVGNTTATMLVARIAEGRFWLK